PTRRSSDLLLGRARLAARQKRAGASRVKGRSRRAGRKFPVPRSERRVADAFAPVALGALPQWHGAGAGIHSPATVGYEQTALAGAARHQSVRRVAIRSLCVSLQFGAILQSGVAGLPGLLVEAPS